MSVTPTTGPGNAGSAGFNGDIVDTTASIDNETTRKKPRIEPVFQHSASATCYWVGGAGRATPFPLGGGVASARSTTHRATLVNNSLLAEGEANVKSSSSGTTGAYDPTITGLNVVDASGTSWTLGNPPQLGIFPPRPGEPVFLTTTQRFLWCHNHGCVPTGRMPGGPKVDETNDSTAFSYHLPVALFTRRGRGTESLPLTPAVGPDQYCACHPPHGVPFMVARGT
jgi:hypothetical protein